MFATSSNSSAAISAIAGDEIKAWERALSLRISLQKVLDSANKLSYIPDHLRSNLDLAELQTKSFDLLSGVHDVLATQTNSKKRKLTGDIDEDWTELCQTQELLQPQWEETINKWHSRLNFGSFEATSKMKTFKQSLWEQVYCAENCVI